MTSRMRLEMDNVAIFWLQLFTSVFVCAIVAVWYVWPSLTNFLVILL
jgi:hypothetical protein